MKDWNIPESISQLFDNVPEQYWIKDSEYSGDNIFAMGLFVESVGIPSDMIEEDYGTQIVLFNGERRIVIDSGGLGDFHLHGFDVTMHETQP